MKSILSNSNNFYVDPVNAYINGDELITGLNGKKVNIEEAFVRNNIPYNIIGSYYFYNRKEIKERRVMNKRRGMELIGIGCVSILLAGTGFFFLQQKQNAVQVEVFDEEEALPEEKQLILDIYTEEDFAAFADSVNQGKNYDGEYVNLADLPDVKIEKLL